MLSERQLFSKTVPVPSLKREKNVSFTTLIEN